MTSCARSRPRFPKLPAALSAAALAILMAAPVLAQAPAAAPAAAGADPTAERHAWFGELHIHSSWSIDAYVFGTHIGPEEATKFAMGQSVLHPGGYQVQLPQPLDFSIVMDHSEYTGALVMADDPDSPLRKDSPVTASMLRFGSWANGMDLYKLLSSAS